MTKLLVVATAAAQTAAKKQFGLKEFAIFVGLACIVLVFWWFTSGDRKSGGDDE